MNRRSLLLAGGYLAAGGLVLSSGPRAEKPSFKPLVVIPTLNEAEFVPSCLESVRRQDVAVDVLVVDGGSMDGTVEAAKGWGVEVRGVLGNKLVARDYAYRHFSHEVHLATDMDVVLPPRWARVMVSRFKDGVVAVSGTTDMPLLSLLVWPVYVGYWGSRLSGRSCAVSPAAYIDSGGFDLSREYRTGQEMVYEEEIRLYARMRALGRVPLETRVPVKHPRPYRMGHFPDRVRAIPSQTSLERVRRLLA